MFINPNQFWAPVVTHQKCWLLNLLTGTSSSVPGWWESVHEGYVMRSCYNCLPIKAGLKVKIIRLGCYGLIFCDLREYTLRTWRHTVIKWDQGHISWLIPSGKWKTRLGSGFSNLISWHITTCSCWTTTTKAPLLLMQFHSQAARTTTTTVKKYIKLYLIHLIMHSSSASVHQRSHCCLGHLISNLGIVWSCCWWGRGRRSHRVIRREGMPSAWNHCLSVSRGKT